MPLRGQNFKHFDHPFIGLAQRAGGLIVKQEGFFIERAVPVLRQLHCVQNAFHQFGHSIADKRNYGCQIQRADAFLCQHFIHGGLYIRRAINQRTVKIEN